MPRQNTSPAHYPQAVLQQIAQLAQNIVIARKRRGETQGQWAQKIGVSQPTMARIERGDPAVAMASYVMCLWLINQAEGLADVIAPVQDHAALEHELARVRPGRAGQLGSPRVKKDGAKVHKYPAARTAAATPHAASPVAADGPGARPKARNDTAAGLAALLGHPVPVPQ